MTRKETFAIAQAIHKSRDKVTHWSTNRDGPFSDLTDNLADCLAKSCPDFNRKRFLRACFKKVKE